MAENHHTPRQVKSMVAQYKPRQKERRFLKKKAEDIMDTPGILATPKPSVKTIEKHACSLRSLPKSVNTTICI